MATGYQIAISDMQHEIDALKAANAELLDALRDILAAREAQLAGDSSMDIPWGTARAAIKKAGG